MNSKKVNLEDVIGIIEDDDPRNAVELKKSLYNEPLRGKIMHIMIKDELNKTLEMNSVAIDFLDKVNSLDADEVYIDFTGVKFINRSFAQGYYSKKLKLGKKIIEVNVPESIQPMFDIMERNFKNKL